MLKVPIGDRIGPGCRVLCLGAHSDDIEIGCGATILKLLDAHPDLVFSWVVLSAEGQRAAEAESSAREMLRGAGDRKVIIKGFRDGFFPYIGGEIKVFFEELKKGFSPDLVFTHRRGDLHQDHRLINELTWNTFRDHLILEYEIVKYDGDLGAPNLFSHLDEELCRRKLAHLMEHFKTQRDNHWFTEETFSSILRIRGIESNAPGRYAEGFYVRKMAF